MNKERKGRFNDVISSLEEAKGEVEDILMKSKTLTILSQMDYKCLPEEKRCRTTSA